MSRDATRTLFLNVGHFFDHMFMLLFTTVVIALEREFDASYGTLLAFSTAGFVAFGGGAILAGWLGDKWSRAGMMVIFFIGIGLASVLTGFARTPLQIGAGLLVIGIFASIYHPCGISMLVEGREKVGRLLGINGVFGNMGVAAAGLVAGVLTDLISWRAAFVVPGVIAILTGLAFLAFAKRAAAAGQLHKLETPRGGFDRQTMIRVFTVIVVATSLGGIIFNATTIAMPKVIDERVSSFLAGTSDVGLLVAAIFAVAAFTQILVGHLIDKYPVKPVFLVLLGLQVPMFLLLSGLTEVGMFLGGLIAMSLVFGQIPILDTLIARHSSNEWRGRIYAVKYVLALGVAASAVPLVAFLHESRGGFEAVFWILGAFALVITAFGLALPGVARPAAPAAA